MPRRYQSVIKEDQSRATIEKLIGVAAEEFSQKGFSGASTETIVHRAGVTRGALYYHFKNKQDLFLAVFKEIQRDIGREIEAAVAPLARPWDQLVAGCRAFLEACADPKRQQILVIDGPAVLNWKTYREVDAALPDGGQSLLRECLQELMEDGIIQPLPIEALVHLLSGAMDEAAVWIAQSEDTETALADAGRILEVLLTSLRVGAF